MTRIKEYLWNGIRQSVKKGALTQVLIYIRIREKFIDLPFWILAEQERKKNKQRQSEGIAVAKAEAVKFGRPKQFIDKNFMKFIKNGSLECYRLSKE